MSTPSRSLNTRVPWMWLLNMLGVAIPAPVLPAMVLRCPLCGHEQLTIMEDYLAGGEWFHCRQCEKTGDMIELASLYWQLSLESTIDKLVQGGFDLPRDQDSIHTYLLQHVEYRKRLRKLWQDSQSYLYHSITLQPLLSELHLPTDFAEDRWVEGPGKVLGGERCVAIEEAILPGSMLYDTPTPRCSSGSRIFRDRGRKEALVLPFYAAPGQICALGFLRQRRDGPHEYIFRYNVTPFINRPTREAGLAMHPDVRKLAVDWQHTIFAVSDPLVYLQLQFGQLQFSNLPLPLVLYQDLPGKIHVRTHYAWEMFSNRRIVFWDPVLSLTTLRQAIAINGWIATCGPRRNEEEKLQEYLWCSTSSALCRRLQRQARPWSKALAKAMLKWTNSQIEDLLLQLQLEAPQIEKVRKACPRELRKRLDSILESKAIQRFIYFDNDVVVERDDGWFCYPHGDRARQQELVCNAKLRLSQVVLYKRTGQVLYVGTITLNGEEIPFTAPRNDIERNPFGWIQRFLLVKNKGCLGCNNRWRKNFLDLAIFFNSPKTVQGVDTVGWDKEQLAFLLPGRIIGLKGTRKPPLTDDISALPAAGLRYSSNPLPKNWHELGNEYELSLFWATLAAILGNVLAPALLRDTKGIGLVGDGAREMGLAVAKKAGCLVREIHSLPTAKRASEEEQRHRWPLCATVTASATKAAKLQWIESDLAYARNCITPLDEKMAAAKKPGGGWHLLTGMEPVKLNSRLLGFVNRIVPLYLRDVCARRLRVEDVLSDLASFAARQGGAVDVREVRKVLWVADETDGGRRCERPRRNAMAATIG